MYIKLTRANNIKGQMIEETAGGRGPSAAHDKIADAPEMKACSAVFISNRICRLNQRSLPIAEVTA